MLLRCERLQPAMSQMGQILPPRNVRGTSVIPPKAAVNADIFVRPVRATFGHSRRRRSRAVQEAISVSRGKELNRF